MESAIYNEDSRITSLRALIRDFQACEQGRPHFIQPTKYGLYYVLANGAMGYFYEQHMTFIELQIKNRSLEGAEEQNQKLRDEVGRLKMEILSFAGKLREVERRDPIYIENWMELAAYENGSGSSTETLRNACSECPTGTLDAAHEDEARVE